MVEKTLYLDGLPICKYEAPADFVAEAELCRDLLKQRGLWKPVSEESTIFNQAVAFANTAAMLREHGIAPRSRVSPNSAGPFVVNSAFAMELYLKALALLHGARLRGHDLAKLFDEMPSLAVDAVKQKLEQLAPTDKWDSAIKNVEDMKARLARHRDAFREWRYLHERGRAEGFNLREAIFTMQVLHETCCAHPKISVPQ